MTRLYSILILLLLSAGAWAEDARDAVANLANFCAGEGRGGSCTLVGLDGRSGIVVGCRHYFVDEDQWGNVVRETVGRIEVEFRGHEPRPAKLLGLSKQFDLSAVQVDVPEGIQPVKVAKFSKDDGPFVAYGYPGRFPGLRCYETAYLGVDRFETGVVKTDGRSWSGFSGGPLFNKHGEQVGVVVATGPSERPTYTCSVYGKVFRDFLSQWMEVEQ